MGVVAFEGGVQVRAPVERVLEATQPGPVVHVLRRARHVQHVGFVEVGEGDPPAVERADRQRLAIELDALDRRADELDESPRAGTQAAELDRGV
jgi:hypothetical protein